jgi:hypothetical protein
MLETSEAAPVNGQNSDWGMPSEGGTSPAAPLEKISGIARQVGRRAMSALDNSRGPVADLFQRVALAIHVAPSNSGRDGWKQIVHTTAHRLGSTARYLRQYDAEDIFADLREVVRRHPESAVMASVAAGFLAGTVLRRHD